MKTRVKICGITDVAAIETAVELGVDALGFVLAESPRQLSIAGAQRLLAEVPAFVTTVVVMRHPSPGEISEVRSKLDPDLIQVEPHPESGERLARTIPVFHDGVDAPAAIAAFDRPANSFVLHLEGPGRGGRGVPVDLGRAASIARRHKIVLAGGLRAENVGAALAAVKPYGVDVSSGVESAPGVKDPLRVAEFMAAVREYETVGVANR